MEGIPCSIHSINALRCQSLTASILIPDGALPARIHRFQVARDTRQREAASLPRSKMSDS